jgi:hypothetical protein
VGEVGIYRLIPIPASFHLILLLSSLAPVSIYLLVVQPPPPPPRKGFSAYLSTLEGGYAPTSTPTFTLS